MTTEIPTIPMHGIETRRTCFSFVEKLKPNDSILQEIDALDTNGLSSSRATESYRQKQTPEPKREIIFTSNDLIPDDEISSIGSVEDEDTFFLFTPNSQGMDKAGRGNAYMTPTLIDNLSSFSLTPRKNNEDHILSIPEFSPTARSSYAYQPQKRKRGNVLLDTNFRSHRPG